MIEQTEQPCPEAVQLTAVLLMGIPGPYPLPWNGTARRPDIDACPRKTPEPDELGPMDPILSTQEACLMCDVTPQTFARRVHELGLEPYGYDGKIAYWTSEQVRAVDRLEQVKRHG